MEHDIAINERIILMILKIYYLKGIQLSMVILKKRHGWTSNKDFLEIMLENYLMKLMILLLILKNL